MFQVVRRVFDEQPVARLYDDRRQLGQEQGLTALNLVDAHVAVGFGEHLGQGLARRETALLHVHLRAEDARARVGHRRRTVRQHPRRDQPEEQNPETADDGDGQYPVEDRRTRACPRSCAMPTTSRFVDVPIDVDMPPMIVARPIGIMTPDTGELRAQRRADQYRHQQHNDRRVVHERAENRAGDAASI